MKSLSRIKNRKHWSGKIDGPQIYDMTDAWFGGAPGPHHGVDGWVEMYANKTGQAIVNSLFPRAHIKWVNDGGLPDGWATFEINLPGVVDAVPDHRLDCDHMLKAAGHETLHESNTDALAFVLAAAVHRNGGRAATVIDGEITIYVPPQGCN
jgi:hypothetical protein